LRGLFEEGTRIKIKDIVEILDVEVLSGEPYLEREIEEFAVKDLLSNVLALSKDNFYN